MYKKIKCERYLDKIKNITGATLSALLPRRNLSYTKWSSFTKGIFGTTATHSKIIAVSVEVINEQALS